MKLGNRIPYGSTCLFDRNGLHWCLVNGTWTTDEGNTVQEQEFRKYYGPFERCPNHQQALRTLKCTNFPQCNNTFWAELRVTRGFCSECRR